MAKKDELQEKYKGLVSKVTFEKLFHGDYTSTKKYVDFMLRVWVQVKKGEILNPPSSNEILKYVGYFEMCLPYIQEKDIYNPIYQNWNSFVSIVNQALAVREDKLFVRDEHIEVLFENDEVLFLSPKTHKGSLKYGANTRWCTASKHSSTTFSNYKNRGELFYLIRKQPKGNKWDKVAFFIEKSGYGPLFNNISAYCSLDRNIGSNDILNSDWDITFITSVRNIITTYSMNKHIVVHNKTKLKKEVNKIASIDIDNLFTIINDVNQGHNTEIKELLSSLGESIKTLNKQIKEKTI